MTCPTQNLQHLHQGKKPHSALDAEVLLEESCHFWTEVDQLYLPYHQNSTKQTPDSLENHFNKCDGRAASYLPVTSLFTFY